MAAIAYGVTGMDAFEALNHAMATVSTGGYSTHDNSFVGVAPAAQWVSIVFMLAGAVPFLLYIQLLRGTPGFVPWTHIPPMLGVVDVGAGLLEPLAAQSGLDWHAA